MKYIIVVTIIIVALVVMTILREASAASYEEKISTPTPPITRKVYLDTMGGGKYFTLHYCPNCWQQIAENQECCGNCNQTITWESNNN